MSAAHTLLSGDHALKLVRPAHDVSEHDIVRAIAADKRLIAITGDTGAGKTGLLDRAAHLLTEHAARVIRIGGQDDRPLDLRSVMRQVLGNVPGPEGADRVERFFATLTQTEAAETRLVLFIDDAHRLADDTLSYLALVISSTEIGALPLQIVLAGRVEMWERLPRHGCLSIESVETRFTLGDAVVPAARDPSQPIGDHEAPIRIEFRRPSDPTLSSLEPPRMPSQKSATPVIPIMAVPDHPRAQTAADTPADTARPRPALVPERPPAAVSSRDDADIAASIQADVRSALASMEGIPEAKSSHTLTIVLGAGLAVALAGAAAMFLLRTPAAPDRPAAVAASAPAPLAPTPLAPTPPATAPVAQVPAAPAPAAAAPVAPAPIAQVPVAPPLTSARIAQESGVPAPAGEVARTVPATTDPQSVKPAAAPPLADAVKPAAGPASGGTPLFVADASAPAKPAAVTPNAQPAPAEPDRPATTTRSSDSQPVVATSAPPAISSGHEAPGVSGSDFAAAGSANVPRDTPPAPEASMADLATLLLSRGDELLDTGDVVGARLLFERVAKGGSGRAAVAAGMTYDPRFLEQIGAHGITPNPATAATWYELAKALGESQGAELLKGLMGLTGN